MKIDFEKMNGLVPAIVQDTATGEVLMLAFMNEEAYRKTCETKRVTFYSRSRKSLWTKGETSGNYLNLEGISVDCDGDALLISATPEGPTCHTGSRSCFTGNASYELGVLASLERVIRERKINPSEGSYTASLFEKGVGHISQKVGEEAIEVVRAALSESDERLAEESADLIYHLMVLLAERGLSLQAVMQVLEARHKISRLRENT